MPTVEERLAVIEEQNIARLREDNQRRTEIDRRFTGLEGKIDHLVTITQQHTFKATCINGGAKVLQGAGAGSGVLLAIYIILEKLGVV